MKSEARKLFLDKRKQIGDKTHAEYSRILCDEIVALEEFKNADTVLLYYPTRREPNLTPLIDICLRWGKNVAFPISVTETLELDFRLITSENLLAEGAYGIKEPLQSCPKAEISKKSLCVVPALAVDKNGYRLGYGKGYYDRFLSQNPCIPICAIFSELTCDVLPAEQTDVPVRIIITQTGATRLK